MARRRTLIVITGGGEHPRTVAVYVQNKKVIAIYYYNELINENMVEKMMSADEKILLLDDSASRIFTFPKEKYAKDELFQEVAKKKGTNDFIYSIDEYEKYYIVSTAHSIFARWKWDYIGSFELTAARGILKKFKRPVVLKGVRNVYLLTPDVAVVYNRVEDVRSVANCLITSPFRDVINGGDSANAAISELKKHVKGTVSRPWIGMRVSVSRSVQPQLVEWAYIVEFIDTQFGNMAEEKFSEARKEMPPEVKMLVKALVIILLAPAITFGTKFIPYSLPFTSVKTPEIPEDIVVTTTAELEKFVYNKGTSYSLFYVEDEKGNRPGYFISESDAVKFVKEHKGWKVVKVSYENGSKSGETTIYP